MSIAAIIATMRARGLSDADIVAVVEAATEEKPRSAGAIRQARYRERKASTVTSDVTCDVTDVTKEAPPSPPYDIKTLPPTPSPENRQFARERFLVFRKAYPKRDGANPWGPAEKKFLALLRAGADPDAIIAGARAYAASVAHSDPKFVAQAITWLNQERWLDDHAPIARARAGPRKDGWSAVIESLEERENAEPSNNVKDFTTARAADARAKQPDFGLSQPTRDEPSGEYLDLRPIYADLWR